ncbi:hypothetical protein ACSQ67_022796 [Phaseolus vulgaris]
MQILCSQILPNDVVPRFRDSGVVIHFAHGSGERFGGRKKTRQGILEDEAVRVHVSVRVRVFFFFFIFCFAGVVVFAGNVLQIQNESNHIVLNAYLTDIQRLARLLNLLMYYHVYGDFDAQRATYKILKVEPFNSFRKKMSVLVGLLDGGVQAFCKGVSKIVLKLCNKVIDPNGTVVDFSDEQAKNVSDIINGFASEALRTLCLAAKDVNESLGETSIPEDGYTLIVIVGIKDPVRPGVKICSNLLSCWNNCPHGYR